jgi:hypothetical protein
VGLVRTNGMLGPVSANFSVQPGTAKSGVDYSYNSPPPLFWVAWRFTTSTISRLRSDGLFGGNGSLQDVFDFLSQADSSINKLAAITLTLFKDPQMLGNLNAQFQLANPSGAGDFYLGGQNIPLGAALGPSAAPFTLVDDSKNSGSFGFASTNYVATNIIHACFRHQRNGHCGHRLQRPHQQACHYPGESGQHHLHGYQYAQRLAIHSLCGKDRQSPLEPTSHRTR